MKRYYPILIMMIFMLIINGCTTQVSNKNMEKVYLNINSKHYDDIDELYKNSSIVVIAKAIKNIDTWKGTFKSIAESEQVFTPVFVEILEVIKGRSKQHVGNTILINQPGGIYKNVEYVEKTTSYLKVGEKYMLFLSEEGGGNYTLISPYEGMVEIVNEDVIARNENLIINSKISISKFRDILEKCSN